MKSSLTHLPAYKQEQVLKITDVIKDIVAPGKRSSSSAAMPKTPE